jgi:tetratricopeptide (TPR) repeat protein
MRVRPSRLLLPALVALCLGGGAASSMLLEFGAVGGALLSQAPAQAQSAEAVAKIAQAITVRIEGATQGSGVLVKRNGNRYTVLTAWHVVRGQRPGEELDIYTSDGQKHTLEPGTIKRIGEVDLAVLTFSSSNTYEAARVGDTKSVSSGEPVYVAGFPTGSNGRLKYDNGKLVANAAVGIDQGYQLLYTNETVSGMSGGPILSADGSLIGMHGRGQLDELLSERAGFLIKTGPNQGVPITYFDLFDKGLPIIASSIRATTADDYLALAKALLGKKGKEREMIDLANQALTIRQSYEAYFYRAYAKEDLGDRYGAIADYTQALAINPIDSLSYNNRAAAKFFVGDKQGAIADYNRVIAINPRDSSAYTGRAIVKSYLGDPKGSIDDATHAIALNSLDADAYSTRGLVKANLGNVQGAINDYNRALAINPKHAIAYSNRGRSRYDLGDNLGAIDDFNRALNINPSDGISYSSRGASRFALGDHLGAIADYNQSLAINPQNAAAYSNRGAARFVLGDKYGALADYSQALFINPRDASAYINRAVLWQSIGNQARMCSDFFSAMSLGDPKADGYFKRFCR